MQAILGTQGAATFNLIAEIIILIGLYIGFYFAHHRKIRPHHFRIQTTMVLANLVLILTIMIPSFNRNVLRSASLDMITTLMIVHAALGAITEIVALYLVLGEGFRLIPRQYRIKKFKPVMRATLALWTIVAILGFAIYYFNYLAPAPATAATTQPAATTTQSAPVPAIAIVQLEANGLAVHAKEVGDAVTRSNTPTIRRHTEHVINLLVGKNSPDYGDLDRDGTIEDPGDGTGLLNYLQMVRDQAAAANQTDAVQAIDQVKGTLQKILDESKAIMAANAYQSVVPQINDIVQLGNQVAHGDTSSIPQIAKILNANTKIPPVNPATVESGTVTVDMQNFLFQPKELKVKKGTTVVFVNKDNAKHTATADDESWESKDIKAGETFSFTFNNAGTFPYYCEYHGDKGGVDMSGVITVTDQ